MTEIHLPSAPSETSPRPEPTREELQAELAKSERVVRVLIEHNSALRDVISGSSEAVQSQYHDRRRLQALIENAPMCVHEIGLDGCLQSMNPKGLAMMELRTQSDAVGKAYLEAVSEADRPRVGELMRRAFEGHASEFEFIAAGDGPPRIFASSFVPVLDEVGTVTRLMGCTRELTSQRAAEEARKELELQVLHVQKLESLGLLAGGVAHDFNNMLAAVLGNLDLAGVLLGPGSVADEALREARTAVERGAGLCSQLLAYAGKGRFELHPVDLNAAAEAIASMLCGSVSPSIQIDVQSSPEPVTVQGSASQLDQVLLNLLVNAVDAFEGRPGTVSVRVRKVAVPEGAVVATAGGAVPAGDYAAVSVEDQGRGISDAVIARIFDPFFSTKGAGRGLGLAAVAGIVRAHGGHLHLETKVGAGSCFVAYFPPAGSASDTEKAAMEPVTTGGQILVVDDDDRVRRACAALLKASGFTTLEASGGKEALLMFAEREKDISAIVLDISMPDLPGTEVLKAIRVQSPSFPVILCSGWEPESLDIPSGDNTHFLGKPYSLENLLRAVSEATESA